MEKARSTPSDIRLVDRGVVVGLTVAGLVANGCFYLVANMVSWMGGPFALLATMSLTVATGLALWFLPARRAVSQVSVVGLAAGLWMFVSLIVFIWADGVQQKFWIEDTERVAKAYGLGALPPDCRITGTYRGSVHTPIECKGTVANVAAWYRGRLGPDWVEGTDQRSVIFTRTQPGLPVQKVMIYRDIVFAHGTSVIVSPTQTNN